MKWDEREGEGQTLITSVVREIVLGLHFPVSILLCVAVLAFGFLFG